VDLVDEQHVARLEIGEERREIARALEHRPRGLAQIHAELVRKDMRQRRLAETRWAEQEHVIERLGASLRGFDEDRELLADLFLPDVFGEQPRAQRALEGFLLRARRLAGHHSRKLIAFDGHDRV